MGGGYSIDSLRFGINYWGEREGDKKGRKLIIQRKSNFQSGKLHNSNRN